MNRVKYRICLLLVLLAAIALGIFYDKVLNKEEQNVKNATFVYQLERSNDDMAVMKMPLVPGKELAG